MTKDIILSISGLHETDGETDEPVEIISPGLYYLKNGKHYVLFEEVMEGVDGVIKTTLKFSENQAELIRSGAAVTRMVFETGKEHMAVYQTPMGPLSISVYTEEVFVNISEEQINLQIDYSLKTEDIVLTESTVRMNVCPKELKTFEN